MPGRCGYRPPNLAADPSPGFFMRVSLALFCLGHIRTGTPTSTGLRLGERTADGRFGHQAIPTNEDGPTAPLPVARFFHEPTWQGYQV